MFGLAMGLDGRLIVIQFVQEEFVRVVRVRAHIEMAASGFFFERITGLGLKHFTHFLPLPRKSLKINDDGEYESVLLINSVLINRVVLLI